MREATQTSQKNVGEFQPFYPEHSIKSEKLDARRRLENRLDEYRLEKELKEFDFDD